MVVGNRTENEPPVISSITPRSHVVSDTEVGLVSESTESTRVGQFT